MVKIQIRTSEQCRGKKSAFISYPYNEDITYDIKSLPDRKWNKEKKEWEIPVSLVSTFIKKIEDEQIELSGEYYEEMEEKHFDSIPEGLFKTKPYQHQIEGVLYGLNHKRWLLGDDQGLGKTFQIINIAKARKKIYGYKHCLIICGVNGLKWNWKEEIKLHSDESGHILGERKVSRGKTKGRIYIGTTKDKLDDLKNISEIDDYFIITNVETLRSKEIAEEVKKLCDEGTIGMVAVDEVHKCKNHDSQQGKALLGLEADSMVAMTGTPLMNNPLDLYVPLYWLQYENANYYQFRNRYCEFGGFEDKQIVGYKNLAKLKEQTQSIMLRRLKDDVLHLPGKVYVTDYVELSPEQRKIYDNVHNELEAQLDLIKLDKNPLSRMTRLRQATGYTGLLSSEVCVSAKLERMMDLAEETIANGRKIVIFSNWSAMVNEAAKMLKKKYKGIIITGETKDSERQAYVHDFQEKPECRFAIGTIGAMGTGLTLTAGTVVVFIDEPWTQAAKEQAVDRCYRIGTKDKVTIYSIIAHDTIDQKVNALVSRKGAFSDLMIDGKTEKIGEIIDYLMDENY